MELIVADLDKHFKNLKKDGVTKIDGRDSVNVDLSNNSEKAPHPGWEAVKFVNSSFGSVRPLKKTASGVSYGQPQFFSPVYTPINWQIPSRKRELYMWCRYFYENEPRVATAIDFYSRFPVSGFETECSNRYVKHFFDQLNKDLNLDKWLRIISHEVHLLGDCYPFLEIECPRCFPAGTFVLTDSGNVKIENIKVGDKVLTYEGTYQEVERTIARKYSGDLVKINIRSLPSIVSTSDHKHYVVRPTYKNNFRVKNADWQSPQLIEAKDIIKGDYLVCPFENVLKNDVNSILFDGSKYRFKRKDLSKKIKIDLDEEFANLIGWYVAEGSTDSNRSFSFSLSLDEQKIADKIRNSVKKYFDIDCKIGSFWARNSIAVTGYSRELSGWLDEMCGHGARNKMIPWFIMQSSHSIKLAFLESLVAGDGHERRNEKALTTVSKTLCYDVVSLLSDLGISCFVTESKGGIDNLGVNRLPSYRIVYRQIEKRKNGQGSHREYGKIYFKVESVELKKECDVIVYNLTVENNHNYVANFFHTKNCGGSGRDGDQVCEHEGGKFKRLIILNPDFVEVFTNPISPDSVICYIPDEELKDMVLKGGPGTRKLSKEVKNLIATSRPIQLDSTCVSHLKYGESGYKRYGISMLRRLFPILSYKTKIMTAQWIVAERLILPIKIVKVGTEERPAGEADIAAVQSQLMQTSNDPTLCIVTHHAFDLDFVGASGKILQVQGEYEFINQEILDGFGLNKALITGEGPSYQGAAMGAEIMIHRLESWRLELKRWVEERIYLPVAKMMGFKEKNEWSEEEYIYPKLKWDSLNLRDRQQERQMVLQLYDKGLISARRVLDEFEIDADTEFEQMRYERIEMMSQQPPGQAGKEGGGGGLGDLGGGGGLSLGGGGGGGGGGLDLGGLGGAPGGAQMGGAPGGEAGGSPPPTIGAGSDRQMKLSQTVQTVDEGIDPTMYGGKILTEKTREKLDREKQKYVKKQHQQQSTRSTEEHSDGFTRDPHGRIMMTSIEQEVLKGIEQRQRTGQINHKAFPSFEVYVGSRPFLIDVAFPDIKVAVECDGGPFHESDEQKNRDAIRDKKLNNLGWIVIRFSEKEIKKNFGEVMKTIVNEITKREQWIEQERKTLEEKSKKEKLH